MKANISSLVSKAHIRPPHLHIRLLTIISWAGRLTAVGAALWPLWKQRQK